MKAVIFTEKHSPISVQESNIPVPGPGEALVKLEYAALNHRDIWIHKGMYAGLKFPVIPGSDGCGRVTKTGSPEDGHWVNQEVIINPGLDWGTNESFQNPQFSILGMPANGTFAEYVVVPVSQLSPKPNHLNGESAAALPLAGVTAFRALYSRGKLKPGEKVLINGAGGGVAQMCLMFAVASGAEVFVTSGSAHKIEKAVSLGAKDGVNYKEDGWFRELKEKAGSFNIIIDSAGGEGFSHLVNLAAFGGRLVIYGGTLGNLSHISPQKIFWKQLSILGTSMGSQHDFNEMLDFVNKHALIPHVDRVFPLEECAQAFSLMEDGDQFGKIVLKI